jgi:Tfp pilus assembly protein PilF/peptidoglycan hydrolase CwlO-like protein
MKSLLSVLLLAIAGMLAAPRLHAQATGSASDLHFNGFVIYNEAGRLEKSGDLDLALSKYKQAGELYATLEKNFPTYEVETRLNRQRTIATAIARLEGAQSKNLAASQAAVELEKARIAAQAQAQVAAQPMPQSIPAPQAGPAQDSSEIPSLDGLLRGWESKMRGKILELERDKKQLELDLNKWGEWHNWAAGEMNRVTGENATLTKKAVALEQAILGMQNEVDAGRAASTQLNELKQQKAAVDTELAKNARQLAAAEKAAADASAKLKTATDSLTAVQQEKTKIDAEHEKLTKERDEALKQRDVANAKALGAQAEVDALKKKSASGDMKKLIAENERLQKELAAAQKQVEGLKADVTRKEEEIIKLRGEVTTLQGQLTEMRQESAKYQTQVADLTRQLKELKDMPANANPNEPNALITQENEMLRNIIMRQLRLQNRQQQAKELIIAQLSKMENASADLLKQVEELKNTRMTLSPDEEKLFKDPAAKELIGSNGVQATLIAASATPPSGSMPAPGSLTALLVRAGEAYNEKDFATAAKLYDDALRVEPKSIDALIGLGMTQQRAGKYADSEAALQKAMAYEPDNANAAYAMGVKHFKQERWKDSMTFFEKSLGKTPQNASARHYLGIISTKLNLVERAEREFKTTLAIDPGHGEAHFNLAVLYATWDPPQWEKAREEYAAALKKGVKPDENLERLLEGGKKVSQN